MNAKKYGVILADPPWSYNHEPPNGAAANHYPTMSLEDMAALPVASMAADDCVLLMWATWPKLKEACLPLMAAWGFEYITAFPWIKADEISPTLFGGIAFKPHYGIGYWARGCSEPLLIGRRGKPTPPKDNFVGLISPHTIHSKKPKCVHAYAESLQGPYLELFARRPMEGWDVWGNEVESTIEMGAIKI